MTSSNMHAAVEAPADGARTSRLLPAIALFLALIVSRIPFIGHPVPAHPDESLFIGAIGFPADYPVQHPGYPLWVAMGTATHAIGLSPYLAFEVWSIVASAVGPVICFLLFRRFADTATAWWLALAFGLSPLIWFSSVTALGYATGTAFGCGTVLCLLNGIERNHRGWVLFGVLLCGIGTLIRSDLSIYLVALIAFAASRLKPQSRSVVVVITFALTVLVGLFATYWVYRRGDPYEVAARMNHTREVLLNTSVLRAGLVDGFLRNAVKVAVNLVWDLGLALPVAAWALFVVARDKNASGLARPMVFYWLIPGLAFLVCVHVVQGYFLVLLPAVYLAMAVALSGNSRRRIALVIAAASAAQFLCYPWSPESTGWKRTLDAKIAFLSRAGLMQIDQRARIDEDGDTWRTPAHDAPH